MTENLCTRESPPHPQLRPHHHHHHHHQAITPQSLTLTLTPLYILILLSSSNASYTPGKMTNPPIRHPVTFQRCGSGSGGGALYLPATTPAFTCGEGGGQVHSHSPSLPQTHPPYTTLISNSHSRPSGGLVEDQLTPAPGTRTHTINCRVINELKRLNQH